MTGEMDTSAFKAELARLERAIAGAADEAALAGAAVLRDEIVTNIVAMDIVETGHYRDSWQAEVVGPGEAAASSDTPYGPDLELGTRKMGARPAVRVAMDSPNVQERMLAAETAVIKRALGG